jgi:hypothetical protein
MNLLKYVISAHGAPGFLGLLVARLNWLAEGHVIPSDC